MKIKQQLNSQKMKMNKAIAEFNSYNINNQELELEDVKYIGQVIDGKKEGNGIMLFKDGSRYEGNWKNDKEEGKGSFFNIKGDKYEGDWKNGQKEGKITFIIVMVIELWGIF